MTSSKQMARASRSLPMRERIDAFLEEARDFGRKHYGIDTRALGIFRIGLGLMLLYDLYSRALHMTAHYTDAGFMPRDRLVGGWSSPLFYSFHNYGGTWSSQVILFTVSALFALLLLVGYRTRLASVMSFILLTSLQGRNYLILQGGDDILRVMLFWSMFTPLASRFSVDAVLAAGQGERSAPVRVFSIGTMALACQLFTMYVVSAILKSGPAWHQNGNAIYLALHHHAFATPFGIWLRELPDSVLRSGTYAVWWLEMVGPFLFFVPLKTHVFRTLLASSYIAFHFGLFLTMNLGHFPWICMLCWLIVLPTRFWDGLARGLGGLGLTGTLSAGARIARTWVERAAPHLVTGSPMSPLVSRSPRWAAAFALVMVVYVGHGTAYAAEHHGNVDGDAYEPLIMIRMNANWGMFAPNPPSESGWFVFVAKRNDGVEIDPWRDGEPVSFEEPELPSATYKVERWRKFLDNIINPRHAVVRPYFLRWMCNDWNQAHEEPEQITRIEFFHMVSSVRWPEKGHLPVRKVSLGQQRCPSLPAGT